MAALHRVLRFAPTACPVWLLAALLLPTSLLAGSTAPGRLERITLAPAKVQGAIGETKHLTATGHYADGRTRNLTQHVTYHSSDTAVAEVPNEKGNRSLVKAVGVGTATISATDPVTGVRSTDCGGDATLTVLGALERLTLTPAAARRPPGQSQHFTATGYFAGGVSRNLTQRVVYRSSDVSVARAANAAGDRSLVDALAPGTATITAEDPVTRQTAAATLTVVGPATPTASATPGPADR